MLIDSHCHLDGYDDLPAILANAQAAGVGALLAIGIGDGPATMHRALEIARLQAEAAAAPMIFATAGIHPQEAHQASEENLATLARLAADSRCIAVGEIGLDYYHLSNPDIATQQAAFIAQMEIAAALRKPITIHCRTAELASPAARERFAAPGGPQAAWEDLLRLIAEHWTPTGLPGIMHCFSGDAEQAERSLAAGFYLSFAGNLTYPRSTGIQAIAVSAPGDRILVETDAPFLAPIPLRGQVNQPAHVALTAKFLAELTTQNFNRLFPETLPATA